MKVQRECCPVDDSYIDNPLSYNQHIGYCLSDKHANVNVRSIYLSKG
jgi:hypothetical protein